MAGNCGFPGRPKNGQVQIEFNESEPVASYTCPSGKMEGHDRRVCINGTWSETIPRCGNKTLKYNYYDG
jgi:Sushi repeat (SCR repeat)